MTGFLLDLIHQNRRRRVSPLGSGSGQIHCPAYNGPCGWDCFLRHQCQTRPEKVMALMEIVDEQLIAALYRLGRNLALTR